MKHINCPNCSKKLSDKAIFCSKCKNQVRCKECKEPLDQDALCCEICGADVKRSDQSNPVMNRIRYDGKSFEAEFTDTVGKDVTETFGKIFVENQRAKAHNLIANEKTEDTIFEDATIDVEAEEVDQSNKDENKKPEYGTSSIDTIFRDKEGKLDLLETRIKANGKIDFAMRLTYLTVLFYKKKGQDTVDKAIILTLLKYCGVYDSNYRKAFAKAKAHFMVDSGKVEFRPAGLEKANEILKSVFDESIEGKWKLGDLKTSSSKGNSGSKSSSEASKTTKTSSKIVQAEKFDAHNNKKTLKALFEEKKPGKGTTNRILTIGYYLNYILKKPSFTDGNIDYAYRVLKLDKRPKHLRQVITNIKNDYAYIEIGEVDKSWRLSRNGEIYVEEDLPPNN